MHKSPLQQLRLTLTQVRILSLRLCHTHIRPIIVHLYIVCHYIFTHNTRLVQTIVIQSQI